jgi:hypothetical protein
MPESPCDELDIPDVWTRRQYGRATCFRALESQTCLIITISQLYPTSCNSTGRCSYLQTNGHPNNDNMPTFRVGRSSFLVPTTGGVQTAPLQVSSLPTRMSWWRSPTGKCSICREKASAVTGIRNMTYWYGATACAGMRCAHQISGLQRVGREAYKHRDLSLGWIL